MVKTKDLLSSWKKSFSFLMQLGDRVQNFIYNSFCISGNHYSATNNKYCDASSKN